jgi:hypothetical protein
MTTRRTPITRASAERLLTERSGGGPTDLRRVLAAASAPATAHELSGEPAAMAQFRAARLDVVTPTRRRSVLKTAAAKLLAANVVIGATVAAATGGVALAAATNHLPGPLHHASGPVAVRESHSQQASPSASNRPSPLPTPTTTPGRSGAHPSGSTTHTAQGSPSPSMVGLCTAYHAAVADNPGKALDNPAFTTLITAAGGKANVPAYCATVLASSSGTPSHPTAAPSTHPTGAPSSHPSAPTTHPTSGPSVPPGQP